ncbi:S53 family peptidase [Candidatus Parvarchaeota archaeon]|nr:S53 family peptidase [Candidatus Parvarchaeota archaeon]
MRLLLTIVLITLFLMLDFNVAHGIMLNFKSEPFQGSVCQFLTPSQIQDAYGFNTLFKQGIYGNGSSVAIIVARGDPSLISDLNVFDSQYSLSPLVNGSNLLVEYPFGLPRHYTQKWATESALDVETFHSLAPGAKIYLVIAPNSSWLFNAINFTVNNLPVQTISISWGATELEYNNAGIQQVNQILSSAENKGINIFAASGDSGAYNGQGTLNVNYPASSPNVVSVGGTVLSVSSGGSYQSETAWNGSGGGESIFFGKLPFQPNISTARMVPDVAFNAGTALCAYINSSWGGYFGTSVAAPSWSALDALINQKTAGDLAFIDRSLYMVYYADGNLTFNNITSGCNDYYCADGTYNMVTGLGSPKAYSLIQALSKTNYKINFIVPLSGITFQINGVNYSNSVSLNFSFGEKVSVKAYSSDDINGRRYIFKNYSGLESSNSPNISFFVSASGSVGLNYLLQDRVEFFFENGTVNTTEFVDHGLTLNVSSQKYYNTSNVTYTLVGFRVDDGPTIFQNFGSFAVDSPLNVSFVWRLTPLSYVFLKDSPPGGKVNVSFIGFEPLSNLTAVYIGTVSNGGKVAAIHDSLVNVSANPEYYSGFRYGLENMSFRAPNLIYVYFIQEKRASLRFSNDQGYTVIPENVSVSYDGLTYLFNDSVWVPLNSSFKVNDVVFNGFDLLPKPTELDQSNISKTIILPVYNAVITVSTFLGIPIVGASVILNIGNHSVHNSTNFLGKTSFQNIPQKDYNLTVYAYGSKYSYKNENGSSQNIQISPLLYQIYLILGIVTLGLAGLTIFESIKRKRRQKKRIKI